MYGELNFNPTLFVAQMRYIIPIAVVALIALFSWATYHERHGKKVKRHENHI